MDKRYVFFRANFGQKARPEAVYFFGQFIFNLVRFAFVNGIIGGGVHDGRRVNFPDFLAKTFFGRYVNFIPVICKDSPILVGFENAREVLSQHSMRTKYKNAISHMRILPNIKC